MRKMFSENQIKGMISEASPKVKYMYKVFCAFNMTESTEVPTLPNTLFFSNKKYTKEELSTNAGCLKFLYTLFDGALYLFKYDNSDSEEQITLAGITPSENDSYMLDGGYFSNEEIGNIDTILVERIDIVSGEYETIADF